MNVNVPELCMVAMVGTSSAGKSTLAKRLFAPTEIISSDQCRAMVSDNPNNQEATKDAFNILHTILTARLKAMKLAVVDATNLQPRHRRHILKIARDNDCHAIAIAMETPMAECLERNRQRPGRDIPERRLRHQGQLLRHSIRGLRKEGFRQIIRITTPQEADELTITRIPMKPDRRDMHGPFDVIGDIHGCHDELMQLLDRLGYDTSQAAPQHPEGRRAVFLGDLVDRGPGSDRVLETAINMTASGNALCVMGNHEHKLLRKLKGYEVKLTHGVVTTLEQLERRDQDFLDRARDFMNDLNHHYVLDDGKLVVAHAGIKGEYQGRASGRVRAFCMYGETNGETDEWGLPVRMDWANHYTGRAMVVYGHTPVATPRRVNNTMNIDTGCVFGGSLTALRYPEMELVSVPALQTYYESIKPITGGTEPLNTQDDAAPKRERSEHLEISDVNGSREIVTTLQGNIRIDPKRAAAALEVMSRFTLDPRWLVYIPPTISPTQTSQLPGLLEHPQEAFQQYQEDGLQSVLCEEKHMGSRAIVVIGKDPDVTARQFKIHDHLGGACYSRTGRKFFYDPGMELQFFDQAREDIARAGLWDHLDTAWLVLDCEIMPWSLKAERLIQNDFAPTGTAGVNTLTIAQKALKQAGARGIDTGELLQRTSQRLSAAQSYQAAYRPYCWNVDSIDQVRTAPFHILAAEGRTFADRPHTWHMKIAEKLASASTGLFIPTRNVLVELEDREQREHAVRWWEEMTKDGGEGMVVKPLSFIPGGEPGRSVQPAVKVRGQEYLRIIYGPEYDLPGNIERMRGRGLRTKRSLALKEFSLAQEGLERFVRGEPLHRFHECAFAVMALESEPVDPRL